MKKSELRQIIKEEIHKLNESVWIYTDKNLEGRNATKLVRAAGEQGFGKYIKRVSDKKVYITNPTDEKDADELMDIIEFAVGRHNIRKKES